MNIGRKTLRNIFLGAVGCIVLYWLLFDTDRVKLVFNFLKTLFAPFALGAGLAFIVNVPMRAIENRLSKIKKPTLRRVIAVLLTFIAVALILFLVVQLLLPQLVTTVETLIAKMPGFAVRVWNWVNDFLNANPEVMEWVEVNTDFEQMDWMSYVEKLLAWVSDSISGIVGGTFSTACSGRRSWLARADGCCMLSCRNISATRLCESCGSPPLPSRISFPVSVWRQ